MGLAGDEIPLACRILSIVDAYDAMTTNRSYRAAQDESYARSEIRNGLGKQFDPEVGKIMLEILEEEAAGGSFNSPVE